MATRQQKLLVVALPTTLVVHALLQRLTPGAFQNAAVQDIFAIIIGIVAAIATPQILKLLDRRTAPSAEAASPLNPSPVQWPKVRALAVLSLFTVVAGVLSQTILDAVWLNAQEMVESGLLTPDGGRRLGIYLMGLVLWLFWMPFMTYVSLSVGRRLDHLPSFVAFAGAAFAGLGLVVAWQVVFGAAAAPDAGVRFVLPWPSEGTVTLRRYDQAIAYAWQLALRVAIVVAYAGWMKAWSFVGWVLHRRRIV